MFYHAVCKGALIIRVDMYIYSNINELGFYALKLIACMIIVSTLIYKNWACSAKFQS